MPTIHTSVLDQKLDTRAYLILVFLLVGNVATSSVVTIMGYYIVSELGMDPWAISVYTVLVTGISVAMNKWFGSKIDQGTDIRKLLLATVLCFCCASLVLFMGASYLLLLILVGPLFAVANSSLSVMYTFGRLYAEQEKLNVPNYNAFIRMSTSTGWIIGPGIAFGILGIWGIQASFLASVFSGFLWIAVWTAAIPVGFRHNAVNDNKSKQPFTVSTTLRMAAFACICFATTNILFTVSMPIYFIEELGLPAFAPGMSFGIKCLVEIPVIFWAARLAVRWGDRTVLMASATIAAVFMFLMTKLNSLPMLAVLSVMEGTYYGLFAGAMVGYMQSFANGRMGRATSIYVSSLFIGAMVGSLSAGFVASFFGFKGGVYLAIFTAGLAFLVVYCLKYLKVEPTESVITP